jgi:hypothetical protein
MKYVLDTIVGMNVFVLCTGRCGSTTFAEACSHVENYSSSHESRIGKIAGRTKYPENHIEVDNRLSWFLGRLEKQYGNEAFYVHLKRDRDETAESLRKGSYHHGVVEAYRKRLIWHPNKSLEKKPKEICRHFYDTVNLNIRQFLNTKKKKMDFQLKTAKEDFKKFWSRIGATGDLSASLKEWDRKYNALSSDNTSEEHVPNGSTDRTALPVRAARKARRVLQKFPSFLRNA